MLHGNSSGSVWKDKGRKEMEEIGAVVGRGSSGQTEDQESMAENGNENKKLTYTTVKREAKKAVEKERHKAWDELYDPLESRGGKKKLSAE